MHFSRMYSYFTITITSSPSHCLHVLSLLLLYCTVHCTHLEKRPRSFCLSHNLSIDTVLYQMKMAQTPLSMYLLSHSPVNM